MKYLPIIFLLFLLSCASNNQNNQVNFDDNNNETPRVSGFVYLSRIGDDNNAGTINSPVRTLNEAIDLAGDSIGIKATDGNFWTSQSDLETSLFGGYDSSFTDYDPNT